LESRLEKGEIIPFLFSSLVSLIYVMKKIIINKTLTERQYSRLINLLNKGLAYDDAYYSSREYMLDEKIVNYIKN